VRRTSDAIAPELTVIEGLLQFAGHYRAEAAPGGPGELLERPVA